MKKRFKCMAAAGMAVLLMGSATLPVPAAAAPASAGAPAKEEVVYGVLNHDGSVSGVYVVNSYRLDEEMTFTDYGDYSEVCNMNTQATLVQNGDAVEITAGAGELYYQGTAPGRQLPWNIAVQYLLDGNAVSGEEAAGKSGALEIRVDITRNPKVDGHFFDNYALQATVTLDSLRCSNITAQGATVANVGNNKQLTYTILPGSGKSFSITADVQDFEMEAMSFNGVSLNLDIEVEDEELLEQVVELIDAIRELDDGAGELLDGAGELQDGTAGLRDGAQALVDGVATIQSGIDTLNSASAELTNGSAAMLAALGQLQEELDAMRVTAEDISALVEASAAIRQGIGECAAGAAALQGGLSYDAYLAAMGAGGVDIAALRQGNSDTIGALAAIPESDPNYAAAQAAIAMLNANNGVIDGTGAYFGGLSGAADPMVAALNTLDANYALFHDNIALLAETLSALPAQMGALKTAINTLVAEYIRLDSGLSEYTAGVAALASGFSGLKAGANDLLAGTQTLAVGVGELVDGCGELAGGTAEMREETSSLEADISGQIDDMIDSVAGSENTEVVSFMSARNQSITSVQFSLRTAAIEIPDDAAAPEPQPEPSSVWDKFVALFS